MNYHLQNEKHIGLIHEQQNSINPTSSLYTFEIKSNFWRLFEGGKLILNNKTNEECHKMSSEMFEWWCLRDIPKCSDWPPEACMARYHIFYDVYAHQLYATTTIGLHRRVSTGTPYGGAVINLFQKSTRCLPKLREKPIIEKRTFPKYF